MSDLYTIKVLFAGIDGWQGVGETSDQSACEARADAETAVVTLPLINGSVSLTRADVKAILIVKKDAS